LSGFRRCLLGRRCCRVRRWLSGLWRWRCCVRSCGRIVFPREVCWTTTSRDGTNDKVVTIRSVRARPAAVDICRATLVPISNPTIWRGPNQPAIDKADAIRNVVEIVCQLEENPVLSRVTGQANITITLQEATFAKVVAPRVCAVVADFPLTTYAETNSLGASKRICWLGSVLTLDLGTDIWEGECNQDRVCR
jgi:hypothetical protein